MKIDSEKIKYHIKEHYSKNVGWREHFKTERSDSFTSKIIDYLKRKELKLIIKSLKKQNNKKILDAGCGNGEYSLALARKFPKAEVYAVDFSETMCELVRKRAKKLNLQNLKIIKGDIDNLPFKESYFDTVLCIDTLHHIPNSAINKSLTELNRVMKKRQNQGKLITDFKNKFNPYVYFSHKRKNRLTYYRTNRSLNKMEQFLKKGGLRIVRVEGIGFPLKFIAPYVVIFGEKN
jgi:ubiquinone/menaquinone biosynthesis C-methylase UbiE